MPQLRTRGSWARGFRGSSCLCRVASWLIPSRRESWTRSSIASDFGDSLGMSVIFSRRRALALLSREQEPHVTDGKTRDYWDVIVWMKAAQESSGGL